MREEFLKQLQEKLAEKGLQDDDAICYFAEMIDELIIGGMNEQEAVDSLGDIDMIVAELVNEDDGFTSINANETNEDSIKSAIKDCVNAASELVNETAKTTKNMLEGIFKKSIKKVQETIKDFEAIPRDLRDMQTQSFDNTIVEKIMLNLTSDDIFVKKTTEQQISIVYNPNDVVISFSEGIVDIKKNNKRKLSINDYVEIFVPEKHEISQLNIKTFSGDIDVKNIVVENLNIRVYSGDVNVDEGVFGSISIKTDSGDVNVSKVKVLSTNVDVKAGDVELDQIVAKDIEVNAIAGDIDVSVDSYGAGYNVDVKCLDYCDRHGYPEAIGSLKLSSISGDINYKFLK